MRDPDNGVPDVCTRHKQKSEPEGAPWPLYRCMYIQESNKWEHKQQHLGSILQCIRRQHCHVSGSNTAMHQEANLQCIQADALNIDWSDLQVRQLQSIGFGVSRDILAEVDTANKFYRHGLLLKQVVNFYNNSATEIIPCQKPMLLQVRPTAKSVAGAHVCCLLMQSLPTVLHCPPFASTC